MSYPGRKAARPTWTISAWALSQGRYGYTILLFRAGMGAPLLSLKIEFLGRREHKSEFPAFSVRLSHRFLVSFLIIGLSKQSWRFGESGILIGAVTLFDFGFWLLGVFERVS